MPLQSDLLSLTAIGAAVAVGVIVNLQRRVTPWRPLLAVALLLAICLLEYRPTPRRDLRLGLHRFVALLRVHQRDRSPRSGFRTAKNDITG